MATLEDLKNALKETLESRGVLNELKAKIRSEIFSALDDQEVSRPKLSDENLLINELIREYLTYNNYQHTLSVMLAETGQPTQPAFDRHYMARELRVAEDYKSRSVPLLYGLVKGLRQISSIEETTAPQPARRYIHPPVSDEPEPVFFTK
jgi:lisH domain-containing protein FOPNL